MKHHFFIRITLLSAFIITGCTSHRLSNCLKENEQLKRTLKTANQKLSQQQEEHNNNKDLAQTISDEIEKCTRHTKELELENENLKAAFPHPEQLKKGVEEVKALQQKAAQSLKEHPMPDANS